MLFGREMLERIASGEVTAALRRWRRPTVKAGGQLMTEIGVLAIDAVEAIDPAALSAADAHRSGYASTEEALSALGPDRRDGKAVVLVRFRLAGPDPREAMRSSPASATEIFDILAELARLDRKRPPAWTRALLEAVATNEGVPAARLASRLLRETAAFKSDVRRLKALGLTQSLPVGYRLSPRGRAVLDAWVEG